MTSTIILASLVALTLQDARELASERAVSVEQARLEVKAAEGDALSATGGLLPSVSAFGSVSTGSGLTSFGFERPVSTQIGVGVTGSWRIVSPGAWAASSAARRTVQGQEALLAWSEAMARRDVTAAYARALAAGQSEVALDQAQKDAKAGMEAVKALVNAGIRPPADLDQARGDYLTITAQVANARAQTLSTCAALEALLAQGITGECELEPVEWGTPMDGTTAHPALIASQEALGVAQAGSRSAWASHLPDIGVQGTAAEYVIPGVGEGFGWSATVDVQVPLTLATGGMGDVKAAKADVARAQSQLADQARSLDMTLLSAEANHKAALVSLEARIGALEAATSAWTQVDARYRAGLVGVNDWLTARWARIQGEIALIEAQAQVGIALAEVEASRGVR